MRFTDEHLFAAPLDEVWAMFRDPASHVQKFTRMGHREIEVVETDDDADADTDADGFRLVVRRLVDVDLPGFAKRVLKPTNTVTTTDSWRRRTDGTCEGTQLVDTQGAPVSISATTSLRPQGDATRYAIAVDLEVKVPLIGGRLADWSKGMVRGQLADEFAAGDAWLRGER